MKTRMLLPVRVAVALLAIPGLALVAFAASSYTVTATLYNNNSQGIPYTLQSDGSPSAVYANSKSTGVSSDLTPTASATDYFQWNLDLSSSSELFYVTLIGNDSTSISNAPFTGPVGFHGVLHSRCFTSSGGYQNWTMIQPGYPDGNCAMRVLFTYNDVSYTLVMSPDTSGTGAATVSCTSWSTSSQSCTAWTDVPNPGAAHPNVAYLYHSTSHGQTYVGSYSLSFNVTLTHP